MHDFLFVEIGARSYPPSGGKELREKLAPLALQFATCQTCFASSVCFGSFLLICKICLKISKCSLWKDKV